MDFDAYNDHSDVDGPEEPHSYLDDPDFDWSLDPITSNSPRTLEQLMEELHDRKWDGIGLILQGYAGLKQRLPQASDAACLDTSMIWYYG